MKALLRTLEAWRVGSRLGFVVAPHRAALGGAVALQLLVVALAVLQPWPMQVAFDRVLSPVAGAEPGGADLLLLCAAVLFGVVVARVLAEYAANLLVAKVGHRVTRALRMLLFRRLLELPPSFHGGQRSGDGIRGWCPPGFWTGKNLGGNEYDRRVRGSSTWRAGKSRGRRTG